MAILLLHAITFLAAFLLFQIELIVAKRLLPVYGGSYFVWGACLVFFQAFLLLGYVFVHEAVRRWGIRVYRKIQLSLIFLPFLFFPGQALRVSGSETSPFLAIDVFAHLCASIGPVFFVLSTMSVALQAWLAASSLEQRSNPYALYATSNAGSLGALLTYPFFFELFLPLGEQELFWRLGYCALALLTAFLFFRMPADALISAISPSEEKIPRSEITLWFLLSAAGVMLFMAVTNVITYAIAPVPLLWVLPLAIYLLAFVLSFKTKPWCPSWVLKGIPVLLAGSALLFFLVRNKTFPIATEAVLFAGVLSTVCLYCQNRLAARKPAARESLTLFYLILSSGGFLGGLVTSWIMPLVSRSVIEYPLALALVAAAVWLEDKKTAAPSGIKLFRGGVLATVPGLLLLFWVPEMFRPSPPVVMKKRNYYGIYEVRDTKEIRVLSHGTTLHGAQLRIPGLELEPSSFYGRTSPIGELFFSRTIPLRTVGVIGLGAGTLAIYTQGGDILDFYELDPDIGVIAEKYFTYLSRAPGTVRVFYGDARRSLELAPERKYDVLVVDAFGGDAIPFHLLNREALALYKDRLNEGGLLLFHISNRFIRLDPVLVGVAKDLRARVLYRTTSGWPTGLISHWMAVTWDNALAQKLIDERQWEAVAARFTEPQRVWTDDYSNILPFIDWEEIRRSLDGNAPFPNHPGR